MKLWLVVDAERTPAAIYGVVRAETAEMAAGMITVSGHGRPTVKVRELKPDGSRESIWCSVYEQLG